MNITTYPSIISFERFVQLKDYKERTQKEYLRNVNRCAEHFQCDPSTLSEDGLREYFLVLRRDRHLGASSMRIAKYSLHAFYCLHLKVGLDWTVFRDLRIAPDQSLPLVLSTEEIRQVLAHIRQPRFLACLRLIYHTGLRVGEAVALEVGDLRDSRTDHPALHVRLGKGAKDRYVPLSVAMVKELRVWWSRHQHPRFLFPSPGRGQVPTACQAATLGQAAQPMSIASLQLAFHQALLMSRLNKPATIHTLRHSYATRLLEQGISIRQIAQYLGHCSLNTTLIYTHLTTISEARTRAALHELYHQMDR